VVHLMPTAIERDEKYKSEEALFNMIEDGRRCRTHTVRPTKWIPGIKFGRRVSR